jgi:hypothetical protein
MKTLEEIRDIYARNKGYYDWFAFLADPKISVEAFRDVVALCQIRYDKQFIQ